jgi:hypothetical protein
MILRLRRVISRKLEGSGMYKLYIFMRSDLDSLNAGKGMAQAAHAANQFWANCTKTRDMQEWAKDGGTFGTTIVLDAAEYSGQLHMLAPALGIKGPLAYYADCFGVVHDPTYPVLDGNVMHLVPLDTCAYFFDFGAPDEEARKFLNSFKLYP